MYNKNVAIRSHFRPKKNGWPNKKKHKEKSLGIHLSTRNPEGRARKQRTTKHTRAQALDVQAAGRHVANDPQPAAFDGALSDPRLRHPRVT